MANFTTAEVENLCKGLKGAVGTLTDNINSRWSTFKTGFSNWQGANALESEKTFAEQIQKLYLGVCDLVDGEITEIINLQNSYVEVDNLGGVRIEGAGSSGNYSTMNHTLTVDSYLIKGELSSIPSVVVPSAEDIQNNATKIGFVNGASAQSITAVATTFRTDITSDVTSSFSGVNLREAFVGMGQEESLEELNNSVVNLCKTSLDVAIEKFKVELAKATAYQEEKFSEGAQKMSNVAQEVNSATQSIY